MSAPRVSFRATGGVNGRICGTATAKGGVQGSPGPRDVAAQGTVDAGGVMAAHDGAWMSAGILVYVDFAQVPLSHLIAVEVDRDLDSPIQSWNFTVDLPNSDGRFGDPLKLVAPALGLSRIDIAGVYRDRSGKLYNYPLITNGICTSSKRAIQRGSFGHRETFFGGDTGARRDRQLVTKIFPAGSGLFRRDIVHQIFELAGESMFALQAGGVVNKEVQLVDASPISVAQDILGVENRRLGWDRHGFLRDVQVAPWAGQAVAETIDGWGRLLGATEVDLETPGDVITSEVLTSNRQVTKDENKACARTVKTSSVETKAIYAPKTATQVQASGCTLSSSGFTQPDGKLIPVTRVVTTLEYVCGTLVAETIETYAYKRIESARYQYSTADGAFICLPGVYLDADGTEGGQERAFREPRESWRLVSRVVTRHFYDLIGFSGPEGDPADPWWRQLSAQTALNSEHPGTGFKLGSITESSTWYFKRAALKAQILPPESWEKLPPREGVLTDGAGYGGAASEEFLLVEKQVTVLNGTADGYLASFVNYVSRFGTRPGSAFWYKNDYASADEEEVFLLANFQTTSYLPTGESSHNVIFVNFDALQGAVVASTVTSADGAPPAIERIASNDTAPATETQLIKAQVDAPALLAEHLPRQVKTSVSYAESEDELARLAALQIAESCASTLTLETRGPDFLIAEGDWVEVNLKELGLAEPLLVKTARYWSDDSLPRSVHSAFTMLVIPQVG